MTKRILLESALIFFVVFGLRMIISPAEETHRSPTVSVGEPTIVYSPPEFCTSTLDKDSGCLAVLIE